MWCIQVCPALVRGSFHLMKERGSSSKIVHHYLVDCPYNISLPARVLVCNQQKSTLVNLNRKGIYMGKTLVSSEINGILEKQIREMGKGCKDLSDWTRASSCPGHCWGNSWSAPTGHWVLLQLTLEWVLISPFSESHFLLEDQAGGSDWLSVYPPTTAGFRLASVLTFSCLVVGGGTLHFTKLHTLMDAQNAGS